MIIRVLCWYIFLFVYVIFSLSFDITTVSYRTVSGPQRLITIVDPPPAVRAATGETAHTNLKIYGFPEPRALTLSRLIDGVDLTSSPPYSVKAPCGFVNMTISDVIGTDHTNYTLTVDNGEAEALTYSFYLYEG